MRNYWDGNEPETAEEKAKRLKVLLIPKLSPLEKQPVDPNPVVAICGECNMEMRRVMNFCCGNLHCPCAARFK